MTAEDAFERVVQHGGAHVEEGVRRGPASAHLLGLGHASGDNNVAERLLRGIAISRKNYLFVGSDKGGERAAILYTLIKTAKLKGLNPEAYLTHITDRLARGDLASRLSEFLGTAKTPSAPPEQPPRRQPW